MSEHAVDLTRLQTWDDLPPEVREQVKLALLDALGSTLAGTGTRVGQLVCDFAVEHWSGDGASILLSGRRASPVGTTLANGFFANALDIDDGHRPIKGHPGAVVLPAALAVAEHVGAEGEGFLDALVAGYEVAIRGGLAWHAAYNEYHGSGAWGAAGAAAAAGKLLSLDQYSLAHALGIAEYHAPIAPIMRCIEHPAMVKDGIGWGSMAGTSAAFLAKSGFTGPPSLLETGEGRELASDLGSNYRIRELYFKEHACCRWAQPAIEAVRGLRERHSMRLEEVRRIRVKTFEAALRLGTHHPRTTEEAQYNLAWPVAAALVDGWVGPEQVSEHRLNDESIRSLASKVEGEHSTEIERSFPDEAFCEVEIELLDGAKYDSGVVGAKGDTTHPLSEPELRNKFRLLASTVLVEGDVSRIEALVDELESPGNFEALVEVTRHSPE